MRLLLLAAASATPALASAAESPWKSAVEIGARTGYALPVGRAASGVPMSDAVAGKVPLWLDAGYRFGDRFYVGGYLEYAFGVGAPVSRVFCPGAIPLVSVSGETDCTVRDLRFGLNAHVHLRPRATVDPWVGVGFGYEILMRRENNTSLRGVEFLNLQSGVDLALGEDLVVGPFASASFARYSVAGFTTTYSEELKSVDEPAVHGFITLGLRGAFRTLLGG